MKTGIIFISLLFIFNKVSVQHILTKEYNAPRATDIIQKQRVEYKNPGQAGKNILWNFSKLKTIDKTYTLTYTQYKDSIIGTEHNTMYYYGLRGDSLLLFGYENPTTITKNIQPELLIKFPINYNDSTKSYFYSKGKYCNKVKLSTMGTIQTKSDAYGMMLLPNGDTLKNVMRIRTIKRMVEGSEIMSLSKTKTVNSTIPIDSINYRLANDSVLLEIETFRWYEKGYRYPVFETVKSSVLKNSKEKQFFHIAFFYPPQEHFYLNEDPKNLAILEEIEAKQNSNSNKKRKTENEDQKQSHSDLDNVFNYNIYPSPVENELSIEYYVPKDMPVGIYLYNIQGQSLFCEYHPIQNWGLYSLNINMNKYTAGVYVLKMQIGTHVINRTIIKK